MKRTEVLIFDPTLRNTRHAGLNKREASNASRGVLP
jgi:hypothetical protein